jgi:hypothetical protein
MQFKRGFIKQSGNGQAQEVRGMFVKVLHYSTKQKRCVFVYSPKIFQVDKALDHIINTPYCQPPLCQLCYLSISKKFFAS